MAILDSLFGEATGQDLNSTMAYSSIAAAAASAAAYFSATLEATTPEARRLFAEYLTQSLIAHEGLTGLALKKGWINPYDTPENQLKMSYQDSESVLSQSQAQA